MYISIPGKLSEIHLHAWLFSNPRGKVLIIVGISWSPYLRVQPMFSAENERSEDGVGPGSSHV